MRVDIVDNVDNYFAIDSSSLNVRCNETTFHHMKYEMRSIVFFYFMGTLSTNPKKLGFTGVFCGHHPLSTFWVHVHKIG
jgi:hypothetical protein